MASENVRTHAGQYEERVPGLPAHGGATTTPSFQMTADLPRQDAIGSRGPDKRRSSAPPMFCAVSAYHFPPLRDGYIRLLRLMPHPDQDAPVQCQLFSHPFNHPLLDSRKGTDLYEALSYFWGSEDKPLPIFMDEGCLRVTKNLHAALLRLRDRSLPRVIWIDAICIDQTNIEERNRQVRFMAEIYARASRVIVWLEEMTVDGHQAGGDVITNSDHALGIIGKAAIRGQPTNLLSNDQEAVLTLLQRSWFQRMWVLQEVAAARHVVIMSLTTEIDGCAFCSGWNKLKLVTQEPDTQARIHSLAYLINGAVLRAKHATTCSDMFSLHIRPLGELMDMYHDRKASNRLDKVYALLGMSSDTPVGITPNYHRQWEDLFCQLVKSLIGKQATVETWDEEIAIIKSKSCVLGSVFEKDDIQDYSQRVGITWTNQFGTKGAKSSHFIFPTSAKLIQVGDAVCLLQGASKPMLIRPCKSYLAIIMIAAPVADDSQPTNVKWLELLQSITTFPNDILLVWDWAVSQRKTQDEDYESLESSREGPKCLKIECKCQDYLDKATRLWNVGLMLNAIKRYKEAGKNLKEAVDFYRMAVGNTHGTWREADEETLKAMDFLLVEDRGAAIEAKCKDGQTPLLWAVENAHAALVRLLLDKGADTEVRASNKDTPLCQAAGSGDKAIVQLLLDKGANIEVIPGVYGRTPLSRAAKGGHEAVVRLLLDNGAKTETIKAGHDATALCWAVANAHEAVVRLLLDRGAKTETSFGYSHVTPLCIAAEDGHETLVRLLLDKGADIEAKYDNSGGTPLCRAAENGHEAVVQLLLDKGADIKARAGNNGGTPLSRAAENGHTAVVRLLQIHA